MWFWHRAAARDPFSDCGTSRNIKIQAREAPEACALRETREELGITLSDQDLVWKRCFRASTGEPVWFFAAHLPEARAALIEDSGALLQASFMPGTSESELDDRFLAHPKSTPLALMRGELPERFLRGLCDLAGVDPNDQLGGLNRAARRSLVRSCTALDLPIEGDRGFTHAEVTMGGIPLREVRLETMESRVCPGLHLIGEILDVDGRIGGFNFQWAWSTGYIAGTSIS